MRETDRLKTVQAVVERMARVGQAAHLLGQPQQHADAHHLLQIRHRGGRISRVSSLVTSGAPLLQAVVHLPQVCGHQDMADLLDAAADIGRAANEVKLSVATK